MNPTASISPLGYVPSPPADVHSGKMTNASRAYFNAAIDRLQHELDDVRSVPDWAIAMLGLVSLVVLCVFVQMVAAFALAPCVVLYETARSSRALRLPLNAAPSSDVELETTASRH